MVNYPFLEQIIYFIPLDFNHHYLDKITKISKYIKAGKDIKTSLTTCEKELLRLDYHAIKSIDSIVYLPHIKILNLASNYIKKLPEEIDLLINLDILDIQDNYIEILPKKFKYLKLSSLNISYNDLFSLKNINIDLEYLYASHNKLEYVNEISILELKLLKLNSNPIKKLPEEIGFLPLRILNIKDTLVQTIPNSIYECRSLIEFEFNHKKLIGNVVSQLLN